MSARAYRRKNASMEDLGDLLDELGWNPRAPDIIIVPSKKLPRDLHASAFAR
jgi:hypothetical protein